MRFILTESKADEQRLIDFAGEELANIYLSNRKKYPSPYNDLYYWIKKNDVDELQNYVDNFVSKSGERKQIKRSDAKVVYEDSKCRVYHIQTYNAAVAYGKSTEWCIAGSRRWADDLEGGKNHWQSEIESNNYHVYFVYDLASGIQTFQINDSEKEGNNVKDYYKYAIITDDNGTIKSVWNNVDDSISIKELYPIIGEPSIEKVALEGEDRQGFLNAYISECCPWNGDESEIVAYCLGVYEDDDEATMNAQNALEDYAEPSVVDELRYYLYNLDGDFVQNIMELNIIPEDSLKDSDEDTVREFLSENLQDALWDVIDREVYEQIKQYFTDVAYVPLQDSSDFEVDLDDGTIYMLFTTYPWIEVESDGFYAEDYDSILKYDVPYMSHAYWGIEINLDYDYINEIIFDICKEYEA